MMLEPVVPSASLTVATVVVCSTPALLHSVVLNPAAAASTITVYDNATTNSGTVLALLQAVANGASVVFTPTAPIYCAKGITAVVTGSSATGIAYFQKVN